MEKQIEQVLEFHKVYNRPIGEPTNFALFRGDIQIEEANELKQALSESDLVEVADAVGDSIYVAIGTAIHFGFHDKLVAILDAIHKSNMSKLGPDGQPIIREDGKILKGPDFKPPTEDIKRILGQ